MIFTRSKVSLLAFCIVACVSLSAADGPMFVRGDINQDDKIDLSDPIAILQYLFTEGYEIPCRKAADLNDSGGIDLSDPIYCLEYMFNNGPDPMAPFEACDGDPTPDDLTCDIPQCTPPPEVSVIFNEIMASNANAHADQDEDSPDWIELHLPDAPGAEPVDLTGCYLTDDAANLTKWQFPDTTMEPGDYLVVFASGKDLTFPGHELHTNFLLEAEGEYLALVAADGVTIMDEMAPAFPEQLTDVSYGLARWAETLLQAGDGILYHVPTAADAGADWTGPDYDASGWTAGTTGLGFTGVVSDGFDVTVIRATTRPRNLSTAQTILGNPAMQTATYTGTATFIDFFNSQGSGNFGNDLPFPGLTGPADDFIMFATGTVFIPASGPWSFGVNSDDGFSLMLTNGTSTFNAAYPNSRGAADTIEVFNITQAGNYDLELLYFEGWGGAEVELFAAQGNHPSFNANDFRLVGDVDNGGLSMVGAAAGLDTDLGAEMHEINASLWTRTTFNFDGDASEIGGLYLSMKYEDGFVAFLNGHEVARANAPAEPAWNSAAASDKPLETIAAAEEFNLTEHLDKLQGGENVLAIQGFNEDVADTEFLLEPELFIVGKNAQIQYMPDATPGTFNKPGYADFVRTVAFSQSHGFFDSPFSLALSTPTEDAQIKYTLDGSSPSATNGNIYTGPLSINATSTVRAAGFKANLLDAKVFTQTYIFPADVIQQSPNGQRPGDAWPSGNVNGQVLDYGMDPDIVNNAQWSGSMVDAMLDVATISIVTDMDNLFGAATGIYVNARSDGRAWERPVSFELLHPDGTVGFSVNAGLRIRGAVSRSSSNPKHSFRVYFRSEYGPGRLQYPLFGGEGADSFDKIDLRTSQNFAWAREGSNKNTMLRDVFSRDAQYDMGQPYTRSRYYHLYLNGHYWGIYQTQERADADFAHTYLHGDPDEYDVIKNDSSGDRALHATDGTIDSYWRLYSAAVAGFSSDQAYRAVQGLNPDGTVNPSGEKLVEPGNLIDYMVCTYYTGDPDAPVSCWAHFSNNIFAIYNRVKKEGFTWYRHDAEHSMGANGGVNEGRLLTDPTDRNVGSQQRHFNPAWLHVRLTAHPEYLMRFADRVCQCFFNGGVFTPENNLDRLNFRAAQIELAIIAESARWGDARSGTPLNKNDWQNEVNYLRNAFIPPRTQIVLNQMRSVNMFPDEAIVMLNHAGGHAPEGFQLTLTQDNGASGTIYYTLNGMDPRLWGGGLGATALIYDGTPIAINGTTTVKARVRNGTSWGALTEAHYMVGLEGLVINEVMASNHTILEDPDEPGEYPDWIELYNGTGRIIDLSGMYLTDDAQDLTKWSFVQGLRLNPGEHLIIYVDDDGTQGIFHTNYTLSKNGETILLVDNDGKTVIDAILFDLQRDDVSFGRYPDGGDTWDFHQTATPGATNEPHAAP